MWPLVIELTKRYINGLFLVHLLINFLTNSVCLPIINKIATENITDNQFYHGIMVYVIFVAMETGVDLHSLHFLEKYKRSFRVNVNVALERIFTDKICSLNWNKIRKLKQDDNINRVRTNAKYSLVFFIEMLVTRVISLFPFVGYTVWLLYISPMSVVMYIVALCIIIKWYPPPIEDRDIDTVCDIWDQYYFYQSAQFTNIIHHSVKETNEKMIDCLTRADNHSNKRRTGSNRYIGVCNVVFNMVFSVNLVLFAVQLTSVSNLIMYIQYIMLIKNHLTTFCDMYKSYFDTKAEYQSLENILSKCEPRENVNQVQRFNSIHIKSLSYTYPSSENTIPFTVQTSNKIVLEAGCMVQLIGPSGHGKSTFMDLICGIIPYSQYSHQVFYDGVVSEYGFDAITTQRIYAEQFESVNWKASAYEIITEKESIGEGEPVRLKSQGIACTETVVDFGFSEVEKDLSRALTMAKCGDFLTMDQSSKRDLKWVHTKNINPSGGQKGRIVIAKVIYRMLQGQPRLLILDEIDKAFQADLAVEILGDIMAYCREKRIICMIAGHSTEVKSMKYDLKFHFENGVVRSV